MIHMAFKALDHPSQKGHEKKREVPAPASPTSPATASMKDPYNKGEELKEPVSQIPSIKFTAPRSAQKSSFVRQRQEPTGSTVQSAWPTYIMSSRPVRDHLKQCDRWHSGRTPKVEPWPPHITIEFQKKMCVFLNYNILSAHSLYQMFSFKIFV